MAGRSAAKRTTPRRAAGAQREGKSSQVKQNSTTTVTSPGKEEISAGGSSSGIKGHWDQFLKFLNQVKVEWRRVSWPSNAELAAATKVVLWTLFVFSLYLGVLDYIFIKIFSWGPMTRRN